MGKNLFFDLQNQTPTKYILGKRSENLSEQIRNDQRKKFIKTSRENQEKTSTTPQRKNTPLKNL